MALPGGDTRRSVESNYPRSRSTATGRSHRNIWQTFLSADITIRLSDKHIHVHNGLPAGMGGLMPQTLIGQVRGRCGFTAVSR